MLKRISDEEIIDADVDGQNDDPECPHTMKSFTNIADAQLSADKKVIEQMIEELEPKIRALDSHLLKMQRPQFQEWWTDFKEKYLGE